MSLKIRLKRVGKKGQPYYRLIVADSRKPRDGEIIKKLGHYNPLEGKFVMSVNSVEVVSWLQKGAVPTEIAKSLLSKYGFYKWYGDYKKNKEIEPLPEKEIKLFGKPKSERLKKQEPEKAPEKAAEPIVAEVKMEIPETPPVASVPGPEKVTEPVESETVAEKEVPEVTEEKPETAVNEEKAEPEVEKEVPEVTEEKPETAVNEEKAEPIVEKEVSEVTEEKKDEKEPQEEKASEEKAEEVAEEEPAEEATETVEEAEEKIEEVIPEEEKKE